MDDTLFCPICSNKLRNIKKTNSPYPGIKSDGIFVERVCVHGFSHFLQLFSDEKTGKVDLLKLSLIPNFSTLLEIDFYQKKCCIECFKWGRSQYIEIDKMIYPDFPHLTKLKEKVSMYVAFS